MAGRRPTCGGAGDAVVPGRGSRSVSALCDTKGMWRPVCVAGACLARLGLDQRLSCFHVVIEHGPAGAPPLHQAGVQRDSEVAAHRSQGLAGQCDELHRLLSLQRTAMLVGNARTNLGRMRSRGLCADLY
jgi:hypothetical protein